MISEFTWPNHDLPSDREAVKRLLQGCGFDHDVAYGKTKVFVRTPRTLFSLEAQRADMLQRIVLFLQKVRPPAARAGMRGNLFREETSSAPLRSLDHRLYPQRFGEDRVSSIYEVSINESGLR